MPVNIIRITAYGKVQGTSNGDVGIWYGVPYGKAPTGALRWKAPEVPDVWDGILDASVPGEAAMQLTAEGVTGTEDCLNLDIYSRSETAKRPVLVFIHGGNNQNGTSMELNGTELAADGSMIVVSLNYRLGLPGFFALPALAKEPNYTGNFVLLDIALALDWIKENIEVFGGDPGNITLSGFSAGGRDVMAALISPLFRGKFQRAIAFSGGMTTADLKMSMQKTAEYLALLALRDGKAGSPAEAVSWLMSEADEVKAYLLSLDSRELCGLIGGANIRMSVFPHLFTDGVTLPECGFDTENYNQVPVMMVTGTTEFKGFADGDAYLNSSAMDAYTEEERTASAAFAAAYGSRMYRYFNTDASAEQMWKYYKAPVYLCNINHGNTDSGSPNPLSGAFHGVFLPLIDTGHRRAESAPEGFWEEHSYLELAEMFQQYLKNFVSTGNPNSSWQKAGNESCCLRNSETGSEKMNGQQEDREAVREVCVWPKWNMESRLSLVLDTAADSTGRKKALAECREYQDSYSAVMNDMEKDLSLSEELKDSMVRHVLNGRWFSAELDERWKYE